MFDSLIGAVSNNTGLLFGGGTAGIVLWVLKKVPNDQIASIVETFFYGCGRTMTLGLSKWSFTKKFWNSTVEPWFIDLVDNTAGACVRGFIKGLRVD
jgi:hypothetical protein